jgi:predicted phage tail protein
MGAPDFIRYCLRGSGGGGGKDGGDSNSATEVPDSLHSISLAKIVDLISTGPIVGPVNGLQSVIVDGTPLQNPDGTMNAQFTSIDFRSGTQTQDYIPGFPSVENESGVGIELRTDTPWVQSFTNTDLSAVRIRLSVSGLSKADTSTGDINGYRVEYAVDVATDGGSFQQVLSSAFDGKTTSTYERSIRINLAPATTGWSVRVRRITFNADSASVADRTNVVSYTEVIDAKFRYPMAAVVGIQVDASQYQSIPTRSYHMQGRIIRVPDNYDPVARTYIGIWTGNFKVAYTNNPAWCIYDLMLHDIYGLGKRITEAQVDKYQLYKIAMYCDEMVPDGQGGLQPRYTCNVYVQAQVAAYKLLQDLASIFNGLAYWAGGQIIVAADMPADPDYTYTAANVIGGKFSRVGSPKSTRYTVALVSWNDLTDSGRQKVEPVFDRAGIKRYGVVQISISAFGCTSQAEAQRKGRRALLMSRLLQDSITFSVSLDYLRTKPGGVIRISDPARMGRRLSGRVTTADIRTVVLDKAPIIAVGDELTCHMPSGLPEVRQVESISGNAVTVDADWSDIPQPESIWAVANSDLSAPLAKVVSITPKGRLEYEILALSHEPGIYAAIDQGTKIEPLPQSVVPLRYQAPPPNVRLSTEVTVDQGQSATTMVIAWDAADRAVSYMVQWRRNNGEWVDAGSTSSLSVEVRGTYAGSYVVRVRAVNSIGIQSAVVETPPTDLAGNSGPPPNVPWFTVDGDVLAWGPVVDAELAGYELRFQHGLNRSWGDANLLVSGIVVGSPYQLLSKPQGQITLMIKAINKAGIDSNGPTYIQTELGDALVANVVETFNFQALGFPGAIANASVVADKLVADGSSVFYGNDLADFYASDVDAPFYTDNFMEMVYETPELRPSIVVAGVQMTLNTDFQGGGRLIEYRITGTDPFYSADDTTSFYGADTDQFFELSGPYQLWPGSVSAQVVDYQFKFTVGPGSVQGAIDTCAAIIDVPDINESFNDVPILLGGTRLPIANSYLAIANVQLTLESNGSTAVVAKYLDKNNTLGPLIKCFDSAGSAVAGVVDARIQGY